jgi:hypothetical protein
MEVGKSAGGRLADVTDGDEVRRRADAQGAFARFEAQGLRSASGDERIELLDGQADAFGRETNFVQEIAGGGQGRIAA